MNCADCRRLKYANLFRKIIIITKKQRSSNCQMDDMQEQNIMRKLRTFQFGWFVLPLLYTVIYTIDYDRSIYSLGFLMDAKIHAIG